MTALSPVPAQRYGETSSVGLGAGAVQSQQRPDPLTAALTRYVEALHARYPGGPDQMRKETLDARANMRRMSKNEKVTAA